MIIGVDPGAQGGFCWGYHLAKPISELDFFIDLLRGTRNAHVVIEKAQAMPKQGVVSMFTYGKTCGFLEGVVAAFGHTLELVPPRVWQAEFHAGQDPALGPKEKSLNAVSYLWPDYDFRKNHRCKNPHDGMVDAVLIRQWAVNRRGGRGAF